MPTLPQTCTSVNRDLDGRFSNEATILARMERRDAYLDSCREADGDILYLAPVGGSRKLAKAIEAAEAVAPVMQWTFEHEVLPMEWRDAEDDVNAYYEWLAACEAERQDAMADATGAGWGHD